MKTPVKNGIQKVIEKSMIAKTKKKLDTLKVQKTTDDAMVRLILIIILVLLILSLLTRLVTGLDWLLGVLVFILLIYLLLQIL
jgi:fatty acid desaturase